MNMRLGFGSLLLLVSSLGFADACTQGCVADRCATEDQLQAARLLAEYDIEAKKSVIKLARFLYPILGECLRQIDDAILSDDDAEVVVRGLVNNAMRIIDENKVKGAEFLLNCIENKLKFDSLKSYDEDTTMTLEKHMKSAKVKQVQEGLSELLKKMTEARSGLREWIVSHRID